MNFGYIFGADMFTAMLHDAMHNLSDDDRRRMLLNWRQAVRAWHAEWARRGYPTAIEAPTFHRLLPHRPEECAGLTCGAKTRAGTPCKRRDLGRGGRCRLHGGMSTGPRTRAGKAKVALNGLKRRSAPCANLHKV